LEAVADSKSVLVRPDFEVETLFDVSWILSLPCRLDVRARDYSEDVPGVSPSPCRTS
jgi:hypothetical protein